MLLLRVALITIVPRFGVASPQPDVSWSQPEGSGLVHSSIGDHTGLTCRHTNH